MDEANDTATRGHTFVLAFIAFVLASRSLAEAPAGDPEAGSIEGSGRVSVSRARGLALDKLRSPSCRQIFAEFQAVDAASLDEVLRELGDTPQDRLQRMRFRDGSSHRLCAAPGVQAVTRTGSLDVFVCGSFQTFVRRDPAGAANVLIHEELHSLGVGEAPATGFPSSAEITARIALRCGR